MKILIINPNTSTFVTEAVLNCAMGAASAGTEFKAVTGTRLRPELVEEAEARAAIAKQKVTAPPE